MEALDRITLQLRNNVFPHACLLSGSDIKQKEAAIQTIAEHFLGAGYRISPDFFEIAERPVSIDTIAALKRRAGQTPLAPPLGGRTTAKKIFLLRSLEALTRDAAPALLKTVEDPGEYGIFIATTEFAGLIPPTIRSRFSETRFSVATVGDNTDIDLIKRMQYNERFTEVPKLIARGDMETFVRNALIDMRYTLRKHLAASDTKKAREAVGNAERLVTIQRMLVDSSVNKRLIGEYIMMLL